MALTYSKGSLLGSGYTPTGDIGQELTNITRRGFIDSVIVQIYKSSPLLAALLDAAQVASGGVSSINLPVQGASMVTSEWTDYSGSFAQPQYQQGIYLGQWNLKANITNIPYLGFEGLIQDDHEIVNRLAASVNDATAVTVQAMTNALYNNTTNAQAFTGLPAAIDDGTNVDTYAGISRAQFPFWKAKLYNAGNVAPTRALVMQWITGVVKNSSIKPKLGMMGLGTWMSLANDFLAVEGFRNIPSQNGFDTDENAPRSGFTALNCADVPIYGDPNLPEGILYLLNPDFLQLYVHQRAKFAVQPFESMVPNYQIGYNAPMVTLAELVCTQPRAQAQVQNLTYTSL